MNNGDREYFDALFKELAVKHDTFKKEVRADIRTGAQALDTFGNQISAIEATVKSLPVRCHERQHGCDARFENTEGYMERLERNQGLLTKANITGFLILLGAIVGKTFI